MRTTLWSQESQWYPGVHKKENVPKCEEGGPHLYSALKSHICGTLYPVLGSKKYTNLLKEVLKRATNVIRALEHLTCEERMRDLGLFNLEKKRMGGDLITL